MKSRSALLYVPNSHDIKERDHLFPLLKAFYKPKSYTDDERQETFYISEEDISFVSDINQADWVILPMSWNYYSDHKSLNIAEAVIKTSVENNKRVLAFTGGDFGVKIPDFDNLTVLRVSGERSKLPKFHKGLPAFKIDPLKEFYHTENIFLRPFKPNPTIGFCGQTSGSLLNALKEISKTSLKNLKYYIGLTNELPQTVRSTSFLRHRVLKKIKKSNQLLNDFIERKKYRAGAITLEEREQSSIEFFDNIKNTDYIICIRGAGNFSARFYETLAMGRIPVFINTDCILPFENEIDWKSHVVWIENNEIQHIEQKIMDFHNAMRPEDYKNLQLANRHLWKNQLTVGGFFKTLFNTKCSLNED